MIRLCQEQWKLIGQACGLKNQWGAASIGESSQESTRKGCVRRMQWPVKWYFTCSLWDKPSKDSLATSNSKDKIFSRGTSLLLISLWHLTPEWPQNWPCTQKERNKRKWKKVQSWGEVGALTSKDLNLSMKIAHKEWFNQATKAKCFEVIGHSLLKLLLVTTFNLSQGGTLQGSLNLTVYDSL